MIILTKVKQQILALDKAKESIETMTANLHALYHDMSIDFVSAQIENATIAARNEIYDTHKKLNQSLQVAIRLFQENKLTLPNLGFILDAVIDQSKNHSGKFDRSIQQAKNAIVTHAVNKISDYSVSVQVLLDENPFLANKILQSNRGMQTCYNQTLDYLMKLGDPNAIHQFISSSENRFCWLQTREQLEQLIQLINPNSSTLLFRHAQQFQHLTVAKTLQFNLLENANFRKEILSLDIEVLQHAFNGTNWLLSDFELKPLCDYKITWMMLTQEKVIAELAAQNKLEDYINNLDLNQLNVLFGKFPKKIMALLQENDLALACRQQMARRLLKLSQNTLGNNAYELIQLGIYQLDGTYDLSRDPDGIYTNTLIKDLIVANWSGRLPWHTYVNNLYVNKDSVSPQAFQFILTNLGILSHPNLKNKHIQLCVEKAGDYLSPSIYLDCINILRIKNIKKMRQLLNIFPRFLGAAQKLGPLELTAVQTLAEQYYFSHPGKKGSANDPIMQALYKNKKFTHKYTILGPMIFAEGRTADLERFLNQARDYKIPNLVPKELVTGFLYGMCMGITGYGFVALIDKVASLANIVNPFTALQAAPAIGNGFTILAAGMTAFLTGGGLASTIAIAIAPVLVSALLGGIVGALGYTYGNSIVNGVKRMGTWISNTVTNSNDQDIEKQQILSHGLKSADPQALRKQLYAADNHGLRDNLAKMLLQQQGKGYSLQSVPAEIKAVIEPIRGQYYNANKSIVLKAADYSLGNLLSALAGLLNLLTFCIFEINYPGPITRYLAFQAQNKLAAKLSAPMPEPTANTKTQAQILQFILPASDSTAVAYENSPAKQTSWPASPKNRSEIPQQPEHSDLNEAIEMQQGSRLQR